MRPISPVSSEQLDLINELNLHNVLGSHSINATIHCYSFRITQWLDTRLTEQRLFEILHRALEEAKKGYSVLVLALDRFELCNFIRKGRRPFMKRISQFFTTSVALCLLVAGCGNPSERPQGSLHPSPEPPVIQILSSQTATTVPTSSVSSTPVPTQRQVNPQTKTVQKPTTPKPSATVKPTTADTDNDSGKIYARNTWLYGCDIWS